MRRTISLRRCNHPDFKIVAVSRDYTNMYVSKEIAIQELEARFGCVRIIDNTQKKPYDFLKRR